MQDSLFQESIPTLDHMFDDIKGKPFITQLLGLESIGFLPEGMSAEDAKSSIFSSDNKSKSLFSEKVIILKGCGTLKFGNTYVVNDIFSFSEKDRLPDLLGTRRLNSFQLFKLDKHAQVNLKVHEIICASGEFTSLEELQAAAELYQQDAIAC